MGVVAESRTMSPAGSLTILLKAILGWSSAKRVCFGFWTTGSRLLLLVSTEIMERRFWFSWLHFCMQRQRFVLGSRQQEAHDSRKKRIRHCGVFAWDCFSTGSIAALMTGCLQWKITASFVTPHAEVHTESLNLTERSYLRFGFVI